MNNIYVSLYIKLSHPKTFKKTLVEKLRILCEYLGMHPCIGARCCPLYVSTSSLNLAPVTEANNDDHRFRNHSSFWKESSSILSV